MFISENHPDRAALLAKQRPPEPSGRVLARIPRRGFAGKPPGELVVSLEDLDGRQFVSLRAWQETPAGMRPGKFMATVRLAEAEQVAAAILEGLRLADAPPSRPAPRRNRRAGARDASPPRVPLFDPPPEVPDPGFDEFATA